MGNSEKRRRAEWKATGGKKPARKRTKKVVVTQEDKRDLDPAERVRSRLAERLTAMYKGMSDEKYVNRNSIAATALIALILIGAGCAQYPPKPNPYSPAPPPSVDVRPNVPPPPVQETRDGIPPGLTKKDIEFQIAMRRLWEDHITWTRLYIISAAEGLKDKDLTAQRLIKNQEDIGNAIKPFYGDAAGNRLTALLKEHILGAVKVIDAAKAKDDAKKAAAIEEWRKNGDEIAMLLSLANPEFWPAEEMKAEMRKHLDVTLEEAAARLEKRYADDIAQYDLVKDHIYHFADILSEGMTKKARKDAGDGARD